MGYMTPHSRVSCWNYRVSSIDRVVDGDTIDITFDLGFDLLKKERVRVAGVDTPEKRTRDKKKRGEIVSPRKIQPKREANIGVTRPANDINVAV